MLKKKKLGIGIVLIITMLFTVFSSYALYTFAEENPHYDVELLIHGERSRGGPIFDNKGNLSDGLWAPGYEKTGIIRIRNNYSERVKVSNLGLTMELEKLNPDGSYSKVTESSLYDKFAKNMELNIKRSNLYVLKTTTCEATFFEMLYEKNNTNRRGYDLSSSNSFNIAKGGYMDLEYTVKMSEEADNDMQGLRATVAFLINSHENPEPPTPPSRDREDNDDDRLIDIPDEPIPEADGHWAHDCIITLLEKGIITGYPDGTIRPDNYITRLEAAVLISRALKLEQDKIPSYSYIDKIPEWSQGYVSAVTRKGVFKGYPGPKFMAYTQITREQMATVLMRAFIPNSDKDVELVFSDKAQVGDWAIDYVKAGVKNNIILGYPDGTFRPKDNITRAEAFTMVCKLLGYHVEH